jgi:chemotaxis-related protein WspD
MQPLLSVNGQTDCWRRIGVWGDRSCPELTKLVHCHNCPVFATAGRRFLDAPSPDGYVEEWTERLITPAEATATDLQSVLIFRVGPEWLALRVQMLVEVTHLRPVHRVPHRAGLLAGVVNIRGELHLCVHLSQLLGIALESDGAAVPQNNGAAVSPSRRRLLVVRRDGDAWAFPVDEIDQVHRFSAAELAGAPATLARANQRLTQGVFAWRERSIGYLEDARLFQALRARMR